MSTGNRAKRRAEQKWSQNAESRKSASVAEGQAKLQRLLAEMPLTDEERLLAGKAVFGFLNGWEAFAQVRDSLIRRYGEVAMLPFLVEAMEQGRTQAAERGLDLGAMDSVWGALMEAARAGLDIRLFRRPG